MKIKLSIIALLLLISITTQAKHPTVFVEDFLTNAKITSVEKLKIGITKPKRITLENSIIKKRALFKTYSTTIRENTNVPQHMLINHSDRYQYEMAAYILNKLLGINMIPETVIRTVESNKGSVQLWVEDSLIHRDVIDSNSKALDACVFKKQIAMMNVFDMLIHNDDRNNGNILYTVNDCRLWLIDHSRAFRVKFTFPDRLLTRKVKLTEELADILMSLDLKILKRNLGKYLVQSQIRAILKRRDKIINRWKGDGKPIYRISKNQISLQLNQDLTGSI